MSKARYTWMKTMNSDIILAILFTVVIVAAPLLFMRRKSGDPHTKGDNYKSWLQ